MINKSRRSSSYTSRHKNNWPEIIRHKIIHISSNVVVDRTLTQIDTKSSSETHRPLLLLHYIILHSINLIQHLLCSLHCCLFVKEIIFIYTVSRKKGATDFFAVTFTNYEKPSIFVKVTAKKNQWHLCFWTRCIYTLAPCFIIELAQPSEGKSKNKANFTDRAVPSTRVARACSSSKKLELYFRARAALQLKKINLYANFYAYLLANCSNQ